jgi:hypothetical protein
MITTDQKLRSHTCPVNHINHATFHQYRNMFITVITTRNFHTLAITKKSPYIVLLMHQIRPKIPDIYKFLHQNRNATHTKYVNVQMSHSYQCRSHAPQLTYQPLTATSVTAWRLPLPHARLGRHKTMLPVVLVTCTGVLEACIRGMTFYDVTCFHTAICTSKTSITGGRMALRR